MRKAGYIRSVNQLKRLVKKLGWKWKRYRKSLKLERNEELFRYFILEIKELEKEVLSKKIDLLYFDGSGFNLNPNQPYGWLPTGQNITLPALRGKGWTVLAALNTASERIIEAQAYEGAANSECIIHFFDSLVNLIKKKTVVILDNASIHKSKIVKSKEKEWRKKGLFFQFIPAYCPELNKIEILWKQMKHFWLRPQDYTSKESLHEAIFRCIQNFGSIYRISFN